MVGHDDEGVEFICAFGAVMLEGFQEEFGVRGDLKEATTIAGDGGDEEGAGGGGSLRDGHYATSIGEGTSVTRDRVAAGGGFRREEIRPSAERYAPCAGWFMARVNACPSEFCGRGSRC